MYSNLERYVADRKPPLGAVLNPYLSINRGLVCFPIMWEGAGDTVEDLSGNNTGTLNGDPQWVAGKYGSCIDLDADDYIRTARAIPAIAPGKEYTVLITATIDDKASGNFWLCSQVGGSSDRFTFFTTGTGAEGRKIIMAHYNGASYNGVGGTVFAPGTYSIVGVQFSDDSHKLYVDGIEVVGAITGASPGSSAVDAFFIGSQVNGANTHDEKIHLLSVYDRALSVSEIAELSQEPFCGFRWTSIEQLAAYIAEEPPPEIKALFMDLSTQLWTIKHSTGIFTKL